MNAESADLETRLSCPLAEKLRQQLKDGHFAAGGFLPSERALIKQHGLSFKTVRRALKQLESEALIVAEERRGYRVLLRANDPDQGCPLAYIVGKPANEGADWFYSRILTELQGAAGKQGWSLLGVNREGRSAGEIATHLKTARACGAIVDGADNALLEQIEKMGIPVVLADAWSETPHMDTVVQDGFAGALQAADYLVKRGHRRIAFLGLPLSNAAPQIVERFGGAASGLARRGLTFAPELCVESDRDNPFVTLERARVLLSSADRPTAVLAPWQGCSQALAQAARDLKLEIGKDFEMVGWSTEEDYGTVYAPSFHAGPIPPAVVWSVTTLAEMSVTRLMQRRSNPRLPVTVSKVPMRLRFADR